MMNSLLEMLRRYGLPTIGGVVGAGIALICIWVVVHWIAEPCHRVVVFFGAVEYTKGGDCQRVEAPNDDLRRPKAGVAQAKQGTPPPQASGGAAGAARPTVTLVEIQDATGKKIDRNHAPFQIRVRGVVTNAKSHYVYLVIDDGNALLIQPEQGLGLNVDNDFTASCYLGINVDPASLNKSYRVFAVATSSPHAPYAHLDKSTIRAQSESIELFRTQ